MPTYTSPPTVVTVVHSPACHFCEDATETLAEIGRDFPLTVELVEAGEPRGEALVREHRAPMYPLVLVDGEFFSSGRLPRKKLRKVLEARAAAVA
jgi:glutaredoxin